MLRAKNETITQRVLLLAVLATGLLVMGARPTAAQDCKSIKNPIGQTFCWVRKARSGEKYLAEANLFGADLSGANLDRANLRGADLRRANLRRANLYWADLSGANLSGAIVDHATKGVNFYDWKKRGGIVLK